MNTNDKYGLYTIVIYSMVDDTVVNRINYEGAYISAALNYFRTELDYNRFYFKLEL